MSGFCDSATSARGGLPLTYPPPIPTHHPNKYASQRWAHNNLVTSRQHIKASVARKMTKSIRPSD